MKGILKYIILIIGISLIIASFPAAPLSNTPDSAKSAALKDKGNFTYQGEDNFINPDEYYTDEVLPLAIDTADNTVEVIIPKDARGNEVAMLMFGSGLISDEKEFEKRLIELELDRKIIYGTYGIRKGETIDRIIGIITTRASRGS